MPYPDRIDGDLKSVGLPVHAIPNDVKILEVQYYDIEKQNVSGLLSIIDSSKFDGNTSDEVIYDREVTRFRNLASEHGTIAWVRNYGEEGYDVSWHKNITVHGDAAFS